MRFPTKLLISGLTSSLLIAGCSPSGSDEIPLRTQLAQKIMLDIRYYCQPDQLITNNGESQCKTSVTELPEELAEMISASNIGGVILFAENFKNIEQTTRLTHQLQLAGSKSASQLPLFITVDQEGGRVARLPREESTAFSGAMAIGATYNQFGSKYAELTGAAIGAELSAVGINVNHAPTVDVNINPDNPVINVRSFSEDPQVVSELALAQMQQMQKQGVIATLKHFPGHGDTSVDSHVGLPRVEHDIAMVKEVDLAPFQYAIDAGEAKMIMTAHIQYPELDSSTLKSIEGKEIIKPATMSRKILTDMLRQQMNFKGVVVTDALDMAGISHFFDNTTAVVETFKAGADIALMPFYVRSAADLNKLNNLLDELEARVASGELSKEEVVKSANRVLSLKLEMHLGKNKSTDIEHKIKHAQRVVGNKEHKLLEQELAEASITQVSNNQLLPLGEQVSRIHLLMPDAGKCQALSDALLLLSNGKEVSCTSSLNFQPEIVQQQISESDLLIAANITPQQSPVELGGMEDIQQVLATMRDKETLDAQLEESLKFARQESKKTLFISLRAPYEISRYSGLSDASLASYSYNVYQDKSTGRTTGTSYHALAKAILGLSEPQGQLPVTIK